MLDANAQLMDGQTLTETGDSESTVDFSAGFAPAPDQATRLHLGVTALDLTDTDETYEIDIQESDDDQTYVSTGLKFDITAEGDFEKLFSVTKRYVKAVFTLGGTTPSITATAYLGPR